MKTKNTQNKLKPSAAADPVETVYRIPASVDARGVTGWRAVPRSEWQKWCDENRRKRDAVAVQAPKPPPPDPKADIAARAAAAEAMFAEAANRQYARILAACDGRADIAKAEFAAGHDEATAREAYIRQVDYEIALAKAGSNVEWESEWEANVGNVRERCGGIKANFIATRRLEVKTGKQILK